MNPAVPLHTPRQRQIFNFILHELKHRVGCPQWGNKEKQCECGIAELRDLVEAEVAVPSHAREDAA